MSHYVFDILAGLNGNSAMGLVGLHLKLPRECAVQLTQLLFIFFNCFLMSGLLPDAWKSALVIPIFKSKSRYDLHNYCVINLTSVCCNSIERLLLLIGWTIWSHTNFLQDSGFRKDRSTEDQMLLVCWCWLCCGYGYAWFSKAFEVAGFVKMDL